MSESSDRPVNLGKGRPTPKRSESERRRGPVAPPPTDRREAARQLRDKQAVERKRVREGSKRGDESALLPRDRGPVRAFVRDHVDSRRHLGVVLLPVIIVLLIVSTVAGATNLRVLAVYVEYAAMLAVLVNLVIEAFRLRRLLQARFPDEQKLGRYLRYGAVRSVTVRRLRVPPPRIDRTRRRG